MAKDTDNLCPLLMAGKMAAPTVKAKSTTCRRARCSWWDKDRGQCCIQTIAQLNEKEI